MNSVQNLHPGCRICMVVLSFLIFMQGVLLISSEATPGNTDYHSAFEQAHEIHLHHFPLQYEDNEEEDEGDGGNQGFAELVYSSYSNESASWNAVCLLLRDKSISRFGLFILFRNLRN